VVQDLGALPDQELGMTLHITTETSACFYEQRRLRQLRRPGARLSASSLVRRAAGLWPFSSCRSASVYAEIRFVSLLPTRRSLYYIPRTPLSISISHVARQLTKGRSRMLVPTLVQQVPWISLSWLSINWVINFFNLLRQYKWPPYSPHFVSSRVSAPFISIYLYSPQRLQQ